MGNNPIRELDKKILKIGRKYVSGNISKLLGDISYGVYRYKGIELIKTIFDNEHIRNS